MKILIYGANGWIGSQFIELLSDVKYSCGKARVDNSNEVENEILEYRPTHVISFIGRTHGKIGEKVYGTIDYLEQEGKLTENIRDNLFAPLVLATICKKYNIHYTYLGTGCIFKYGEDPKYEFEEKSLPNFFGSSYSVVKGFTDRLMHLYDDDVLNLRIRMPITGDKNPRNFITKITTYEKICSVSNSMTVLPELLPLVFDMMMHNITGTMNLTNPGTISHNEILSMYRELVDPSFEWQNFTETEQRAILDSDRSNNCLDTRLLESLYPDILGIKDAVRKCLITYKTA
jgi:dTDP-4-dehydrorhamnose reductase